MEILPHQQRMLDERDELCKKTKKLSDFFHQPQFDALGSDDQTLLRMQFVAMMQYQVILQQRILKFTDL